MAVTIPIFDAVNYKCWNVKMRTLFLSMDLWDTVENGYDDETNKEKKQKDAAALSHIQQGVSDWIFPTIMKATKAKAWDILQVEDIEQQIDPCCGKVIPMTPVHIRQTGGTHLLVATLVATVIFTAGFMIPSGFNGNDGRNQGMVILTREAAFKAFMVKDTIALSSSISAVLIHFYAAITSNQGMLENQVHTAAYLIICAVVAMVLAFVTGTYAVLAHSSGH